METEKLSKQDERRIVDALERVIAATNAGVRPNDAVRKEAEDGGFSPEVVRRMAEAFNTSRTLAHFKTAGEKDRGASFPLVDAQAVLSELYPEIVVHPAKAAAAREIPFCYSRPETGNFFAKSAAAVPKTAVLVPYPSDSLGASNRLFDKKGSLLREIDGAKSRFRQSVWKMSDYADKAAEYFSLLDRLPFAEVERNVVGELGKTGKGVMDLVYRKAGLKEARHLGASEPRLFDAEIFPFSVIFKIAETAEEVSRLSDEVAELEEKYGDFAKEAGFPSPFAPTTGPGRLDEVLFDPAHIPFGDNPLLPSPKFAADVSISFSVPAKKDDEDEEEEKEEEEEEEEDDNEGGDEKEKTPRPFAKGALLGDLAGNAETAVMSALGLSGSGDKATAQALSEATDPIHESRLRAIGVRAMLNDFLANDPIISGYDPDNVIGAYNQFSQLSPNVAQQPTVARAVLRNMLQSDAVIQPFDAEQLSRLNKELGQPALSAQIETNRRGERRTR